MMRGVDYLLLADWLWRFALLFLGTVLYAECRRINNRPIRAPRLPEWMRPMRRVVTAGQKPIKPRVRGVS